MQHSTHAVSFEIQSGDFSFIDTNTNPNRRQKRGIKRKSKQNIKSAEKTDPSGPYREIMQLRKCKKKLWFYLAIAYNRGVWKPSF